MKTLNFQKITILLLAISIAFLFGCKKTENTKTVSGRISNKTIKQIAFSGSLDGANGITQTSTDKSTHRYLIPIKTTATNFYKYYLLESNSIKHTQIQSYLISKNPVSNSTDLFTIPINKDGVTAYEGPTKNGNYSKILLKHKGKELDLNSTPSEINSTNNENTSNFANPEEGGGYCIDHWWITYETETGNILSIDLLGSECYGCMQTNTCTTGGGGGGGTPTSIDSAILFSAVLDEYDGIHDGEFNIWTERYVYVPYSATSASPFTSTINWPVVDAEYYKVDAKTVTKSYIKPTMPSIIGNFIEVSECKTVSTLFSMKKSSLFWKAKWEQSSIPDGIITYVSGTPYAWAGCEANGYIHIEARSSWLEIFNSLPTITASSDLTIHYRHPPMSQ